MIIPTNITWSLEKKISYMNSWLNIVQTQRWNDLQDNETRRIGAGQEEQYRRIAFRLTQEWERACSSKSYVSKSLHVVNVDGDHTYLVFCHQLTSCSSAVDVVTNQSVGLAPSTNVNVIVLYFEGSTASAEKVQKRYKDSGTRQQNG